MTFTKPTCTCEFCTAYENLIQETTLTLSAYLNARSEMPYQAPPREDPAMSAPQVLWVVPGPGVEQ